MKFKTIMGTAAAAAVIFIGASSAIGGVASATDGAVCPSYEGSQYGGTAKIDVGDGIQSVTVTAPDGFLVGGYCVKAGSAQQGEGPLVVVVDPPQKSVTFTSGQFNQNGQERDISHYSAWFVPEPQDEGQWCSPGYWKNHLGSWAATGVSPDTLYSASFGAAPARSPKGVTDNAPTDPTLLQVVSNPQWYGGAAANNVGDLLSAAHPDVNFDGERVEDSCPLS